MWSQQSWKQKTAKIGWLDRVCIKVRSKTRVHAYRERAYEEVDLSDHLPVRVGYQIVLEPTAVATSRALAAKPLPPEENTWRVVDWAGADSDQGADAGGHVDERGRIEEAGDLDEGEPIAGTPAGT